MYRHPNGKTEDYNKYLFSTLEKCSKNNKWCLFMGDFNINLLNFQDCQITEEFINTVISYGFLPHILQPTRITDHTATLINKILSLILMNLLLLMEIWFVTLQIIYQTS